MLFKIVLIFFFVAVNLRRSSAKLKVIKCPTDKDFVDSVLQTLNGLELENPHRVVLIYVTEDIEKKCPKEIGNVLGQHVLVTIKVSIDCTAITDYLETNGKYPLLFAMKNNQLFKKVVNEFSENSLKDFLEVINNIQPEYRDNNLVTTELARRIMTANSENNLKKIKEKRKNSEREEKEKEVDKPILLGIGVKQFLAEMESVGQVRPLDSASSLPTILSQRIPKRQKSDVSEKK